MSPERLTPQDPRIQSAVTELQDLITRHYPQASFTLAEGEDPEGVYLTATADTEDLGVVLELAGERLVDLQVEQGLPLYLVATRPIQRVREEMRRPRRRVNPRIEVETLTS